MACSDLRTARGHAETLPVHAVSQTDRIHYEFVESQLTYEGVRFREPAGRAMHKRSISSFANNSKSVSNTLSPVRRLANAHRGSPARSPGLLNEWNEILTKRGLSDAFDQTSAYAKHRALSWPIASRQPVEGRHHEFDARRESDPCQGLLAPGDLPRSLHLQHGLFRVCQLGHPWRTPVDEAALEEKPPLREPRPARAGSRCHPAAWVAPKSVARSAAHVLKVSGGRPRIRSRCSLVEGTWRMQSAR